jgi:hypothetical protein
MSKFCGDDICKRSVDNVTSLLKSKCEEQVFSPCSKNSVYHPITLKPHSDYLKKTMVDLNCIYISGQSSSHPRTAEASGIFTTLDEFYFTTAEKENFGQLQMHIVPNFMNDYFI